MSHTQFSLLKTRRFLPLFLTQFLGAFNDNLFKNALVILITYEFSHQIVMKSSKLTALSAGIFILPFFIFSAMAGQLADKFERSRLVQYTKLIEVSLAVLAIFAFYLNSVILLLAVLFLLGTQSSYFGPLKYALLPDLLQDNELISGNGFVEAGTFLAILLGTAVGGIAIALHFGRFFVSTLMLSIAIIGWLCSRFIPYTPGPSPTIKIDFNLATETWRILRFTFQHKKLRSIIFSISWFWLLGSVFLAELPPLVKNTFHAKESIVTLLLIIFSVGIGIGSLLCNTLLKGKIDTRYVPLAALMMSLFIFDFCFTAYNFSKSHSDMITLNQFLSNWKGIKIGIDFLLISISAGLYIVPLYTTLQHDSPEKHRARVIASNNIFNAFVMVTGAILSFTLLSFGSTITMLFLLIGILNSFMGYYTLKLYRQRKVQR